MRLIKGAADEFSVFKLKILYKNHANVLLIEKLLAFFIDVSSLSVIKTIVAFIKQNYTFRLTGLVVHRAPFAQNFFNLGIGNQRDSEKQYG